MRVLHGPDRRTLGTTGTPVVDLMLVVLVAAGLVQAGRLAIRAAGPGPTRVPATLDSVPAPQQVVLTLRPDGAYLINGIGLDPRGLEDRLARIYRTRPVKLLFIEAAPTLPFGDVREAARRALRAGVEMVGYLPPTDAAR